MGGKDKNNIDDDFDSTELLIRLAYDRECFRRILEGLTEGVIIVYRDGIVSYANPAACHILAWHGEYEGRLLKSLLCCCDGNLLPFFEVDGSLVPALLDGNVLSGLEKFTSKGNPCVTVEYLVTPLSEDDEVVGAAVILNNISERILAEGELSEANKRLQRLNDELKRKNKRLQESSVTDSLTRLYNHRHIIERLQEHVSASDRYQRHLSVMMFDIDFFKKVNDTYGHPFGDEVLEQVSKTLRQEIRTVDIAGRYGGEEFLVVMPETDLSEALVIAERVRLAMEALTWKHPITLTISAGVATWQKGENASELISRADTLLYEAKEGGRNLVKG